MGFCLLLAWFVQANGMELLLIILGAAVLHELGHCAVLYCFGGRVRTLQMSIFGALMETDSRRLSYNGEAAAVLAGPLTNLLAAILASGAEASGCRIFAGANLVLCLFNLLPVRPLDGGRALELLVSRTWGEQAGERAARIIGGSVSLALSLLLFWLVGYTGGSLWLLPAAAGLGAAAWREWCGK